MFSIFFWCFYFVLVHGDLRQVTLPVYTPPSQEMILNTYFQNSEQSETGRSKKAVLSVSDKLYKTIEAMKKELTANISNLQKELNITEGGDRVNVSSAMQDYIRSEVFRNFITPPVEVTTYRYPTAVWSSQNYEKLKNSQKYGPRNLTKSLAAKSPLNPSYVYLGNKFTTPQKGQKDQRRSRGKTKWKDTQKTEDLSFEVTSSDQDQTKPEIDKSDFADRFLEQSLTKYLTSSNLREQVGNVSVKTFSDILQNITDQKSRRFPSPYDENKELRMKFREEVILKKKNNNNNETKSHARFLDKQLQKRLEKMQDIYNERDKDKILANMWKYSPLNKTTDGSAEKKNATGNATEDGAKAEEESGTEKVGSSSEKGNVIYITTQNPESQPGHSTERSRGTIKYFSKSRYESTERFRGSRYGFSDGNANEDGNNKNVLKLIPQESSYYRKGQFPSLTFIGQPEKPGVIPGKPQVDYPVHSFPPATKFKCPKFKEGQPRMIADRESRCQVFYICTGDGPTTAMLCPNGTMFNENYLVCDWWYNVNC